MLTQYFVLVTQLCVDTVLCVSYTVVCCSRVEQALDFMGTIVQRFIFFSLASCGGVSYAAVTGGMKTPNRTALYARVHHPVEVGGLE